MASSSASFWPEWNDRPVFTALVVLLLVGGVCFMAAEAYKSFAEASRVGYSDQMTPNISVNAQGKSAIKNDTATVDIGVTKTASTASDAQTQATDAMNALTAAIKAIGVASDDIETSSYTVSPQYDYDVSPATIRGYEANQTLTVKIRQSDLVNAVLAKAGELGATNVGSLRFEADDDTTAENDARQKAIAKARAQAEAIATSMGATLGDVVSYSESRSGGEMPYYRTFDSALSVGASAPVPDVQMGQSEVQMDVYINYALK